MELIAVSCDHELFIKSRGWFQIAVWRFCKTLGEWATVGRPLRASASRAPCESEHPANCRLL